MIVPREVIRQLHTQVWVEVYNPQVILFDNVLIVVGSFLFKLYILSITENLLVLTLISPLASVSPTEGLPNGYSPTHIKYNYRQKPDFRHDVLSYGIDICYK